MSVGGKQTHKLSLVSQNRDVVQEEEEETYNKFEKNVVIHG